eukprot:TRINITY_DN774083_c0_g1_i1.p1 TRINITY_DN774083_c0_g1~~TRINITY_DN774083_c0_g1_i1.p1  ORF type:complete len:183 (+),score=8.93 TRINITY_DN774083_c0_g1_i1:81-629(+)
MKISPVLIIFQTDFTQDPEKILRSTHNKMAPVKIFIPKSGNIAQIPPDYKDKIKTSDFVQFQKDINDIMGKGPPWYIMAFALVSIGLLVFSSVYSAHHWIFIKTAGKDYDELEYQSILWGSRIIAGIFAAIFIVLVAKSSKKIKRKVADLCKVMDDTYPHFRWEMQARSLILTPTDNPLVLL